jgi:hypothetical protein
MKHASSALVLLGLALVAGSARAQGFAQPPDEPVLAQRPDDSQLDHPPIASDDYDEFRQPGSTVRIHTGPALRISRHDPDGGLFAAIDSGERAAGVSFSGAWVRVGADNGLQQYGGELWLDFGAGKRLHPILAAGAGVARLESLDATGTRSAATVGVGTLRGTLEYMLPIRDTDARAGLDVIGAVPAIRSSSATDASPWMLVVATVGVGF